MDTELSQQKEALVNALVAYIDAKVKVAIAEAVGVITPPDDADVTTPVEPIEPEPIPPPEPTPEPETPTPDDEVIAPDINPTPKDRTYYEELTSGLYGFGENAVDPNAGHYEYVVRNLHDAGEGSLVTALQDSRPMIIRFEEGLSGSINLLSRLSIGTRNKIIDGRGADITLSGAALWLTSGARWIVFHNVKLGPAKDDNIVVARGATDIWFDSITTTGTAGDGTIDVIDCPPGKEMRVTLSRLHVPKRFKVHLFGNNPGETGDAGLRITMYLNWYDESNYRLPMIRYGWLHSFLNLRDRWRATTATRQSCSAITTILGAQVLCECDVFRAATDPDAIKLNNGSEGMGFMKVRGSLFLNGARKLENQPEQVFIPSQHYGKDYRALLVPDSEVEALVKREAGWKGA